MQTERQKQSDRKYKASHREVLHARGKIYRDAHKTEARAKRKEYWLANMQKMKALSKAWRQRNREKDRQRFRAYIKAHPDKLREYRRRWAQKSKLAHRAINALRRTQKVCDESQKPLVQKFYALVRSKPYVKCYWCGEKISGSEIHVDHVIALAKGGNHAIENLAASCAPCNQSKNAKLPHEWAKHPQMFFTL
jgi:5-methylcytosine-specific restriction endonuclease McrA